MPFSTYELNILENFILPGFTVGFFQVKEYGTDISFVLEGCESVLLKVEKIAKNILMETTSMDTKRIYTMNHCKRLLTIFLSILHDTHLKKLFYNL